MKNAATTRPETGAPAPSGTRSAAASDGSSGVRSRRKQERRCWLAGELVTGDEYRERQRQAKGRVDALRLTQRWIAEQLGSSANSVNHVLNGHDPVPSRRATMLERIEALLGAVEAGEVVPA